MFPRPSPFLAYFWLIPGPVTVPPAGFTAFSGIPQVAQRKA
jgi:hypothetical protein